MVAFLDCLRCISKAKLSDIYLCYSLRSKQAFVKLLGLDKVKKTFCSLSRCKTGGLPQLVSFVCHLDLRSHVYPAFQSGGVMRELYILNMNKKKPK